MDQQFFLAATIQYAQEFCATVGVTDLPQSASCPTTGSAAPVSSSPTSSPSSAPATATISSATVTYTSSATSPSSTTASDHSSSGTLAAATAPTFSTTTQGTVPTTAPAGGNSSNTLSTAAKVGIGVGVGVGILLILVIAVLATLLYRSKHAKTNLPEEYVPVNPQKHATMISESRSPAMQGLGSTAAIFEHVVLHGDQHNPVQSY
jgi:hypothetical protein